MGMKWIFFMRNDAVYTLCGLFNEYLVDKYNCKHNVVSLGMGNTLSAHSDLFDIYIRCIEKILFGRIGQLFWLILNYRIS